MTNRVLESAKWIASQAQNVLISDEGIELASRFIAEKMEEQGYSFKKWKEHTLAPKTMDETSLDWCTSVINAFLIET
jgi:hypothetical protein